MKHIDKKISVIMPAYNEGGHIYKNLKETRRVLEEAGSDFEIILVNDGSTDNTYTEALRAANETDCIRVVNNSEQKSGKGNVLKEGFKYASGRFVVFLDADLDIHPEQLHKLFSVMRETKSDVVIGSKRHPQSKLDYPFARKIASDIYAIFLWLLFRLPLRDTQTGVKIYKYEVLENIFPKILCKKYAFDVEILANANKLGYKITEAPIVIEFRRGMKWGRLGFRDFYVAGNDTLAIFYRMYILKYYDRALLPLDRFPKVSIVIVGKQPNSHLEECIKKCRELDYPEYEIIYLPDNPCAIPSHLTGKGDDVRIIPTGEVGPSFKRDTGSRHASGEIIAFLDDDTYPTKEWLKNAVKNFGEDDIAAVGGPAVTPETNDILQRASGLIYSSWLVGGSYGYRYVPRLHKNVDDFPSCNLIIRKSVLDTIGGFDTKYWPGEDTVICLKITKQLKKKIVYDPDAIVYHHRRRLFIPHLKQIKSYAQHRGYFVKRFPETSMKPSYFLPSIFVLGLLLGWPLIFFTPAFKALYLYGITAYTALAILTGIKTGCAKTGFLVFAGVISSHITYGIWFLKGLLSRRLVEE